MKKSLLFLSLSFLAFLNVNAQTASPSDNLGNLIISPKKSDKPFFKETINKSSCTPAVTADTSICDSGSATVTASGGAYIVWYDDSVGGNILDTAASYTSPFLTSTTTYYAEAVCLPDTTLMPLPAQTSTYSPQTRGYWFVAPTNFIITAVRVPTDASTGNQSIEVVRIDTTPPAYPTMTNNFTKLGLWQNVAGTNMITTFIPVNAGDTIGILGDRNGTDSYANPDTSSIDGMSVTLTRLGFQDDLDTVEAYDLFTESGGSISRVEMYYSIPDPATPRTAATITVQNCSGAGIHEINFEKNIVVYPNPSQGSVWIENSSSSKITIKLFDITGKNISSISSDKPKEKMDFSSLSNGTYFIQIIGKNESIVKKIVLNK